MTRTPAKFYASLATGAPAPLRQLPVKLERMIQEAPIVAQERTRRQREEVLSRATEGGSRFGEFALRLQGFRELPLHDGVARQFLGERLQLGGWTGRIEQREAARRFRFPWKIPGRTRGL